MPPRKKKPAAGSVGLDAAACAADASPAAPAAITALAARIEADGGAVLARYREPFGGHWVLFSALPIDKVAPTPYQRELSKTHADRLAGVIPKVGRFLDPVIAVPTDDDDKARYITPNGMHRLSALKKLGARAVTALVLPEPEIAFRILALNTEKAHNLRDKALEAIRMARALAEDPVAGKKTELDYAFELEQPAYLTIGICYEQNGRFSGGAYQSVVARCDEFADTAIARTIAKREKMAARLIELDEAVNAAVVRLKEAGFTSMYLKPVVVARINPLRWQRAAKPGQKAPRAEFDKTIDKMIEGAKKLDASKIKPADLAAAAAMNAGSTDE
jgi:ParB family transcriptional regulator, chromosome partitioning protein